MGLASALSTALTGMTAAETQIDVAGNNLANSQTVGFKASQTVFASQFLQTLSLGSGPTAGTGGTDPRQTGLGVQVAEVTPDFSQGTIQISSSPSDLAIQGDGFFIVQATTGEQLYTRNGVFKTNAENQLVNTTGNRLLGYGVDSNFALNKTQLVPLTIPLGSAAVAKSTSTVDLQGVLSPTGDIADTAEVIQSAVLGDASTPQPVTTGSTVVSSAAPDPVTAGTTTTYSASAGGSHVPGDTFRYRLAFVDSNGKESPASSEIVTTVPAGDNTITLGNLPTDPLGQYSTVNVYRTDPGGTNFKFLGSAATGGTYTDDNSVALSSTALDTSALSGNYSYMVTFYRPGYPESRPSPVLGPQNVVNGRVLLTNLPSIPAGIVPPYTQVRVYRNLSTDSSKFYLVDTVNPGTDYTDTKSDATIAAGPQVDMDGPKAGPSTLLTNLLIRNGSTYQKAFDLGSAASGAISFTPSKGGKAETTKSLQVTPTSTLQDLVAFMDQATGIRSSSDDAQHPIPNSADTSGASSSLAPGGSIVNGAIKIVSNNGTANAVAIPLSSLVFTPLGGLATTPNLGFGSIQTAKGQSTATDFVAYDSLGIPVTVRLTAVLESRNGTSSTYRWFADSPQNDPNSGNNIAVGSGLVSFDGNGNFVAATNTTVSIDRTHIPSQSPLEFNLNFANVSGLSASSSTLAAARQDGSPPGTLTSFSVNDSGIINGIFSNGVTRDLGQLQLARFANSPGLVQRGQNLYAQGVNSGLPIQGEPGQNGTGGIIAGAVEQSNADVGKSMTDLVLASTQYRGNARVITTTQQLFDELLNLRR